MKIDFAILWVDDRKDFVASLQPQLKDWMDTLGFGLVVHEHRDETGILDDLRNKDIELIVLDYKLPRKKGDELIDDIRKNNYYHDIIFYSQGGIPDDLFPKPPDGVFFVEKGDAKDRIKALIDLKIRRASDLATLRGWIVADAIELEKILGEVLAKYFEAKEELFKERVLSEYVFDFGKKHTVLNGILKDQIAELRITDPKSEAIPKLEACKKVLDSFPKEIIEVRNALAHQMAMITETGDKKIKTRTKSGKEIVLTQARCAEMRKDFRKHMDNLIKLKSLI